MNLHLSVKHSSNTNRLNYLLHLVPPGLTKTVIFCKTEELQYTAIFSIFIKRLYKASCTFCLNL